jgi:hypothetical protein
MSISFLLDLRHEDWNHSLKGWNCPLLKVPGAKIDDLYASSHRVDSNWYKSDTEVGIVQWIHDEQPPQLSTAKITLSKDLEDREISLLWKKLAIILPLLASLLVALIPRVGPAAHAPASPTFEVWTVKGTLALGDLPYQNLLPQVQPPNIVVNSDGSFQFDLPIETRQDGGHVSSTVVFYPNIKHYKAAVVHLEPEGYRGHTIDLTKQPIPIEKTP